MFSNVIGHRSINGLSSYNFFKLDLFSYKGGIGLPRWTDCHQPAAGPFEVITSTSLIPQRAFCRLRGGGGEVGSWSDSFMVVSLLGPVCYSYSTHVLIHMGADFS